VNRVRALRGIFRPVRGVIIGGWRTQHNEEILTCTPAKYNSNDQIEDEMGKACNMNVSEG
jgi:hypothetical protein